MNDKTKILYDQLTKDGYDIGDYNSFSNNVKDDNKRKSLYDAITKDGYDVGDYDTFSAKLVGNNSQPTGVNNVTTTPQPTNTEETFVQNPKVRERILANTPDYFKSKGNNLSTLPLGTNIQDANDIAQEEQQRVALAERSANDPYMRQQELEHVFKPKNQEQINAVNKMIADARRKRAEERRKNARAVKSDGLFSTLSQAYVAGEQNDTDKQLEYASSLMEEAQNITNEAKKKGNTNFFSGFARGFKDAPLDGWAMGLQDLKNYSAAKKVLDKVDKGEQLNPAEDALMQALVTNAATKMYYSGDLGRGYKAGSVTAESLPFMLDMIAGMGTIQAVTKPASKALVKYATEKAAKYGLGKATTGLAKGAARTIAGLGDVAAHTATFGGARVAADYQRRGMGDIQVSPNMDGTVSYAGRDNVQTGAEAIAKSAISTAAETGTELLGEYFAPMLGWVGKVTGANKIGKIIPASVGKAYSNIVNSQGFKNIQEIASRAKIADPIGEYGEEVVNNLISTAIGDMTPEELVDLDQNIDTFLGVAPMSVLFGAAGTGGYLREKYKNYRDMRTFENQMQETMGEDWSGVKEALQDADIETARDMVKDILSSDMQPDMKKKAINYISSVLQEQTLQEVDKQQMPEQIAQAKQGIIANMQKSKDSLIKKGMSENEISTALNDTFNLSPEEMEGKYGVDRANDIYNYQSAYTDYADYNYWVQNKAYDARKEAESQVEKMTNATTGTVMRINSGLSKNPVNVLRGNIVFDNDGNVDQNQSDNTIYYLADDGKVKMAPISMFQSLVDDTPAEGLAQQAGQDAEEEVLQGEEAQINFTPEELQQQIEIGTRFTQGGNNYEVTSKAADGYVVAALDEEGNQIQSQLVPENDLINAINSQNQVQPEQPVAQPDMNAQPQEGQTVQTEQPATQQTPDQPATAMSRIPLNEKGEQDFEKAPVEDTSAALIEISDSIDDAKDTAQQMIDNYNNELKKAEKAKTTGSSIQEIVRLKQEKKANIQAINDKIAYWNNVASQIESQRPGGIIAQAEEEAKANQQRLDNMTQEQQQAAQQEVQKKIDSGVYEKKQLRKRVRYVKEDSDMGESVTPLEHVLREIATGRVTFNWNDSGTTQGLGSHLGLASSPEERKKLIWALSSDGMTPEAAAEQIHADMPENLQGMVTDQDIFNMILNSFQEYGSPSKMWEEAKRMHGTDIEENIPGYDEDMERMQLEWEAENNGMTVPEWIDYCDYIEEELNNRYSSVSDEELNTIFEQIYNEYEQRRTETESAGSTEGQPDGKQGDEVLPASESDNTGTGAEVEEQPQPANQVDGESGSVVPEPEGTVKTDIEKAREDVDQNPTEAQKEAGNYKKGHVKIDGYDVTIENPKGSVRSGKDANGNEWSVTMNNDYGYIRGTEGVDGDHIDVFLSDNPESGDVFVIDQVNPDGSFDEHKVMYGFKSALAAKRAYLANYSKGWTGLGNITRVSKEEFKKWIDSSNRKTKPFAEYKSVVPVSKKESTNTDLNNSTEGNRIVSSARYEELKKRMREKLNQLNAGIDPEIIAIGAEMAVYHIERGAIKFADYASAMIKDMGDMIRPYLKAFYSSARYMPQAIESGLPDKMTPDSEVSKFDVTNFDKKSIDVLEQIKNVAKEQEVEKSQKSNKVKPASELSGDSAQYQDRDIQEKEAVKNIGVTIRERALNYVDEVSNTPLTMKDVKNILKDYSMLADMSITDMQELVELAMTNETRKVALKYIASKDKKFGYDLIVAMYKMQPLLNARDSTRFERQQYSTPTPFGYVMGQFINANKKVESVLEPSAGNGALTITFPASIVHVNDIDERRIQNLRTLGYGEVTTRDALLPFDESVDAVVTNPPFGSTVAKEFDDGKLKISSLEGLMAINALDSMKDNGRAAIVIGGNTSYRENGAMQSKDMKLFAYLYSHYNVVDVINLDGEMYKRNGTKYDVRIILINGRKTGPFKLTAPPVKSKARAEQVKTFDELYNRVQDDIRSIQQMGDLFNGTEGESRTTDNTGSGENSNVSNRPKSGQRGESVQPGKELGSSNNVGSSADTTISGQGTNGKPATERETGTVDNENGSDAGSTPVVQEQGNEQRGSEGGRNTGGVREGNSVPTDSGNNAGRGRLAVNLGDEKVPYPNRSQSGTLMSVVPANQAQVLADSLANIGDVDQFLVDQLGYSSKEELFGYLAAEQIDSVSLAINQMNKGNGFIIGDMTGVGKGRQGAALVRYAVRKGYKPIYFTQKPALFADNYRDLSDIGSSNLRPFIIASDPKNAAITDAAGNVVHKLPSEKERKRVFDYILKNGTLPDEYDYVITTYSQINNGTKEYEATDNGISEKDKKYKKKSPSAADKSGQIRRDVIKALSKNNIMILDESHTAGGSGGGSMFMQYIMPDVKGVTFLSATFAKRADNMPLYAMKTDLAKSGVSPQEMIQAIAQGGVTLQEIMSKQLVQSGQMIRRERDFSGVTIDWMPVNEEEDAVQRKQFDEVSSIFSDIRAFQKDYITPMVTNLSDELAGEGGFSDLQQGTKELGVTNTPFASKMYNLVNQLLFSLKSDAVANRVIYNLKNGFKPIISFTNTMEGFLDEAPKDTPMDKVPNFSLTLMRALDGVMRYSVDTLGGEKENKAFLVSELNDEGQKRYYEIRNKIENLSANLPISPMDAIKMKIEQEGYKVGEITGRTLEMVKDENGKYVIQNRKDKDKKTAARDFNNGKLDVLMINKSGSTGISLHASPKFEDQRQRVMVFAQFQSDINDEVQMRGRIDRTGQIYRGKYEYIMSSIPAEQRLQMMFKAKLKSLDANTTSSQKSKFNEMEVVDYLNKYGDDVTWQYMVEHPELSEKLGDPLGLLNQEDEEDSDNVDSSRKEGCAAKIARYLPFLPVSDQEEVFKEITDAYNVKIQLLNDAGENDLEITTMPLRAKTISKKIWKPGTDPNSGNAFADNTYLEEVEVDVLKKPMKASEIKSTVSRMTEGEDFSTWRSKKIKEIESVYNDKIESLKDRLSESAEERSQKAKKLYIEKSKEARKNKKNEFTDEEIEKMSDVVVEDILKKADESFNKQKKVIEARKENILKQVNSFEPLRPLVIPFNLDEDMATLVPSRGMFLGFKFSKDFSPSSSTAVFATMDGRRKVEIPLKQEKAFRSINMNTMMQPTFIKDVNLDNWDSYTPTQSRKKSYIITGNLLQALVDIQKNPLIRGYLVSYSTENGDTRQGILMSDSFKPGDLTMSVPISSKLIQIQQGESVISDDKRVIVEKNNGWKSGYVIKVPRSKKMGGEFFEDNKLRSLAGNKEFVTRGNYMVAEISSDNLPEALDRLSKMGVNVAKKAKLEDADAGDVRLREDNTRSMVDPFINDLMKEYAGEDLSRYPFEDKRTDPNNDYNVYWGYSEPLYNGKNIDGNEEVPEVIRDIIRNDEYEIDKQNIIDTLKRYIEFNEGFDEELEYKKVLDWFQENKDKFSMSLKVNLIVDRDSIPDNLYRVEEKDDAKTSEKVKSVSEKLNVPVEVVTSPDQIKDQSVRKAIESGRKVKGWYSISEGKVYLYLPNATSMEDAVQTLLHEGVAHYGLRRLVGEEKMDDFLDDIFTNASKEVRQRIIDTLPKYGYNSRIATEEYMARMAEKGVDDVSFWDRIKQAFKNLLRRIGINISINDNELRYILWRSRQNLNMERPLDMAKDVAMQYQMGVGNYYRDDTSDGSREAYENSLQGWRYKAREAYQDSMLALKNLQDVVAKVSGKPIQVFENAYIAENQLSSRNTTEARRYNEKFFKPLMDAEGKLIKKYGLTHKAIERYMMLAHGIERNVEMTFREQLNDVIKNNPDDAEQFAEDFRQEKKRLRGLYSGYQYLKELTDYIGEVGDYSATKAILQSMDNENHDSFQDDALDYVKDFEGTYDVKELWDKTNRATKETLRKSYESGMMSKDHFANVSNMFMYYVPLRGWNEKTAEDVYEYINSERSPVNSVLKSMRGRKSIPDEIMATIGNMAESAIVQGNRNMMKQAFMNMVMNHPTDLATLKKAWYVYDPATDEWNISFPDIEENDTPETIAQKIQDHDDIMKKLKDQGIATQKSSKLNINYKITKGNAKQHVVQVKNGGKDYLIYVNANPRAAQAVNGLTNPDAEKNPIFNAINTANRWLAANFTTRNPAFVMSNLSRDIIFSMAAINIKEDGKYSARFRKNIFKAMPVIMRNLRGNDKGIESDEYFKEFIENGGETGYMHLTDVNEYKKKVRQELRKITGKQGSARAAFDYTLERLEDFNRWAEDVSRFSVYMTSRQMGRSIVDSINDAKEVTVNFNKKGAGYKTGGFFGITAGAMRNLYLFFNASVQSLTNFNRLRVKNPAKFYSTLGGFMAAGFLMPVINNLFHSVFGDGDDPYNDLPEWVRRNNLCIYAGDGEFVTIPLPIELRAFYGLGDYVYQLIAGREKPTPAGISKGTISQLADLLPLNPTGNEGFRTFMPDALSPIFETYVWNEDFTGKPIAKLTPFNERDPEWKRVYKGTSAWLVDTSKFLNDLTNGDKPGKEFRKGFIDFNPAKVENLFESYFGGMAKFLNQAGKTIYYGSKSLVEGEKDDNLIMRNVPALNRFVNTVDERNAFSGINTEYFNLRDEMEQFKYELNGVKKNFRKNPEEYRQMVRSDMFQKYMKYKPYQKKLDKLYQMGKEQEGEERKQTEDMITETRRELLQAVK